VRVYYYTIIEYNYTRNPRARVHEDGIELVVDPGGPPPQRLPAAPTGPLTPPPPYVLACGGGVVVVAGLTAATDTRPDEGEQTITTPGRCPATVSLMLGVHALYKYSDPVLLYETSWSEKTDRRE